jgi:hypothetical protein
MFQMSAQILPTVESLLGTSLVKSVISSCVLPYHLLHADFENIYHSAVIIIC